MEPTPDAILNTFRTMAPDAQVETLTSLLLEVTPTAPLPAHEVLGRMWFAAYNLAWAVRTDVPQARREYVQLAGLQIAKLQTLLTEEGR